MGSLETRSENLDKIVIDTSKEINEVVIEVKFHHVTIRKVMYITNLTFSDADSSQNNFEVEFSNVLNEM
jgi:hypothetical protein